MVEFRSWNDYKDKDLFGTVSGTQIKSDLLIFGKQLSPIHTKWSLVIGEKNIRKKCF